MAQPKAIFIYLENEEKLNTLTDAQRGRLLSAVMAYGSRGELPDFSDDPVLAYAFLDLKGNIDRDTDRYNDICKRRSEAGKKGGQAKQANATFATNEQAKASKSSQDKPKPKLEINKEKIIKEKFGIFENVLLTREEFEKLKIAFSDFSDRIDRLSEYLASSGKRYKSHYATILSWARKDGVSRRATAPEDEDSILREFCPEAFDD